MGYLSGPKEEVTHGGDDHDLRCAHTKEAPAPEVHAQLMPR